MPVLILVGLFGLVMAWGIFCCWPIGHVEPWTFPVLLSCWWALRRPAPVWVPMRERWNTSTTRARVLGEYNGLRLWIDNQNRQRWRDQLGRYVATPLTFA